MAHCNIRIPSQCKGVRNLHEIHVLFHMVRSFEFYVTARPISATTVADVLVTSM